MAYRNMSPEAMITVSQRWLDPERDLPTLSQSPMITGFLPVVESAHNGLIDKQVLLSVVANDIETTQTEMARSDARHDRLKRGVHYVLTGLAELADANADEDRALAYTDLRDRLLPLGLLEVSRPYIDEIGDAERLPGRLDDETRALMASIETPSGTIEAHVDAWVEAANELGRLSERRAELERARADGQSATTTQAEALKAKNQWIRMARALEAILELDTILSPAQREEIVRPLKRAEAEADVRIARRRADGDSVADGDAGGGADEPEAPAIDPGAEPAPDVGVEPRARVADSAASL
ncbi:MAG: hypothetical protein Tsb0020_23840 [Haliangiales bacterium]